MGFRPPSSSPCLQWRGRVCQHTGCRQGPCGDVTGAWSSRVNLYEAGLCGVLAQLLLCIQGASASFLEDAVSSLSQEDNRP